mgnify:CR=1 FL=1
MAFIREKIEERIVRALGVIRAGHAEHREERQHVLLRVERLPFVDLAVHVDGKMRYRQEWPADVDEVHLRRVRVCAREHNLARKRQRSVEPRAPDHAAVDLDVERAVSLRCDDRRGLDAQAREVRVRRRDVQVRARVLPDAEGHERRVKDAHEIRFARLQMPGLPRFELHKARLVQQLCAHLHRMERRDRPL